MKLPVGVPLFLVLVTLLNASQAGTQMVTASSKSLPLPGEAFELDGHDAFVILPDDVQPDTPWVWYAPTLRNLPSQAEVWMFERFLKAGVAVAGIDVGESYGSPTGRALYRAFYDHLVEARRFGPKPVLLARSRGGLMLYNWAVENPQSVAQSRESIRSATSPAIPASNALAAPTRCRSNSSRQS